MPKLKKAPKTKNQILADMEHLARINREKSLVKLMFPMISTQDTIYNAQTVLSALSGFIKAAMDKKQSELLVGDLIIDLSKEEDSKIKTAILQLNDMLKIEKAKDTASLLERFGNILAQHSANEFMKKPMSEVTIDSIIAPDAK
jgi:hypothetical protein